MSLGTPHPLREVDAAAERAVRSACAVVSQAGSDDEIDGVRPALVAIPASTSETARLLAAAAAHGLTVVPRGRGTTLTWGQPPSRADLVVDLSGQAEVLDHAAGDLVVAAQAGCRLADLQRVVAGSGQRLTVDEMTSGGSLGGLLATGRSGPLRASAGGPRDLLIGITVVRADGVVAKAGGRVVKNVAGYDLGKLMTGSYGTLGVITEALFRLHPRPASRRFVTVPAGGPEAAWRRVRAVIHSQAVPAAVEIDWPATGPGSVSVLVEGLPAAVDPRAATVRDLLADPDRVAGQTTRADVAIDERAPAGWARYPWPTDARGDERAVALKLTFALSGLTDVLATARSLPVPVGLRGSAGAGVVYGSIPAPVPPGEAASAVEGLRAVCARHGGSLVVLDAPLAIKRAVDTWGPVGGLELMRRVKHQFDPDHRLAPGRFVGGI